MRGWKWFEASTLCQMQPQFLRLVHMCNLECIFDICLLNSHVGNILYHIHYHFYRIACVKDTYPKGLKWKCKKEYSCKKLAKNKCRKTFSKAISAACNRQISTWSRSEPVRNFCKKSCKKCIRKYIVICTSFRNYMIFYLWSFTHWYYFIHIDD